MKVISLSSRQYAMLRTVTDDSGYMSIQQAGHFDQRSFGSMLHRRYVVYIAGRGFKMTKEGRAAFHDFLSADIIRRIPSERLTHYFDPSAYGLSLLKKKSQKAVKQEPKQEVA